MKKRALWAFAVTLLCGSALFAVIGAGGEEPEPTSPEVIASAIQVKCPEGIS